MTYFKTTQRMAQKWHVESKRDTERVYPLCGQPHLRATLGGTAFSDTAPNSYEVCTNCARLAGIARRRAGAMRRD